MAKYYDYETFNIRPKTRIGTRIKVRGKWTRSWWHSKHWALRKNMKFGHLFVEKKSLRNQVVAILTGNTLRRRLC